MSMADIMEKVAATRVRKSPRENGASDLRPDAALSRELVLEQKETATPRRLLLVMSETKRMAALNALVRSAGYEARAAFNGSQALDLLRLERPDVLIVDYHLTGMDGLETLRRLRKQNPGRQLTPVVMLVSDEEAEVRNEAAELGVYQVMDSNYEPAVLLSSIRQVGNRE
jgi:CheY-like chemotaxis protein